MLLARFSLFLVLFCALSNVVVAGESCNRDLLGDLFGCPFDQQIVPKGLKPYSPYRESGNANPKSTLPPDVVGPIAADPADAYSFTDGFGFVPAEPEKKKPESLLHTPLKTPAKPTEAKANMTLKSPWLSEVGTPIYILEQDDSRNTEKSKRTVSLWEVRPSEHKEALMYSGSTLLASFATYKVQSFALVGFKISESNISPGTLLVLDRNGKILRISLNHQDARKGLGPITELPGTFQYLESAAESKILAVTSDKQIVWIDAEGKTKEVSRYLSQSISQDAVIRGIFRTPEGVHQILVTRPSVFSPGTSITELIPFYQNDPYRYPQKQMLHKDSDLSDAAKVYSTGEGIWFLDGKTSVLYCSTPSTLFKVSIESFFEKGLQDGEKFDFLGSKDGSVYARIGVGLFKFSLPQAGTSISYKPIEKSIFGKGLRSFGIHYELFNSMLVMQPRHADRSGGVRADVVVRENPSLESKKNNDEEFIHFDLKNSDFQILYNQALKEVLSRGMLPAHALGTGSLKSAMGRVMRTESGWGGCERFLVKPTEIENEAELETEEEWDAGR